MAYAEATKPICAVCQVGGMPDVPASCGNPVCRNKWMHYTCLTVALPEAQGVPQQLAVSCPGCNTAVCNEDDLLAGLLAEMGALNQPAIPLEVLERRTGGLARTLAAWAQNQALAIKCFNGIYQHVNIFVLVVKMPVNGPGLARQLARLIGVLPQEYTAQERLRPLLTYWISDLLELLTDKFNHSLEVFSSILVILTRLIENSRFHAKAIALNPNCLPIFTAWMIDFASGDIREKNTTHQPAEVFTQVAEAFISELLLLVCQLLEYYPVLAMKIVKDKRLIAAIVDTLNVTRLQTATYNASYCLCWLMRQFPPFATWLYTVYILQAPPEANQLVGPMVRLMELILVEPRHDLAGNVAATLALLLHYQSPSVDKATVSVKFPRVIEQVLIVLMNEGGLHQIGTLFLWCTLMDIPGQAGQSPRFARFRDLIFLPVQPGARSRFTRIVNLATQVLNHADVQLTRASDIEWMLPCLLKSLPVGTSDQMMIAGGLAQNLVAQEKFLRASLQLTHSVPNTLCMLYHSRDFFPQDLRYQGAIRVAIRTLVNALFEPHPIVTYSSALHTLMLLIIYSQSSTHDVMAVRPGIIERILQFIIPDSELGTMALHFLEVLSQYGVCDASDLQTPLGRTLGLLR